MGCRQKFIPRMIAPAARSFFTTPASSGTMEFRSAYDPAVVFIPGITILVKIARTGLHIFVQRTLESKRCDIVLHEHRYTM